MKPNRWAPRKGPVMGRNMAVATDHPATSEIGLSVMRDGGNAVDAAVAISWLLPVVKPMRSHLGGDLFYLVYTAETSEVTAINASGCAPMGATAESYGSAIPERGLRSVAVPGFVDGVLTALDRFGSRPLAELIGPAIAFAADGFPVSLRLAELIAQYADLLRATPSSAAAFMPDGSPPAFGSSLRQPDLARTLTQIRDGGRDAFYAGPFAKALLRFTAEHGAGFAAEDLATHTTQVGKPINANYRGLTVYEQPPVSQGHIVLEELRLLEGFDLAARSPEEPEVIHLMVEAKKLAFADRLRFAGDPRRSEFDVEHLLSDDFIERRRAAIDPERASDYSAPGETRQLFRDTTSFAVVDGAGNAVAAIQSVFSPWGSGVVVPGTGVLLNNRMLGFVLEPGHPNCVEPGKRPVHTLNNYLVTHNGSLLLAGGTPGGHQQVQTNMQVLSAIIDGGFDIQTAVDLARWGHTDGRNLLVESRLDAETVGELERRGHRPSRIGAYDRAMGVANVVAVHERSGARFSATDLRGEGNAQAW